MQAQAHAHAHDVQGDIHPVKVAAIVSDRQRRVLSAVDGADGPAAVVAENLAVQLVAGAEALDRGALVLLA